MVKEMSVVRLWHKCRINVASNFIYYELDHLVNCT